MTPDAGDYGFAFNVGGANFDDGRGIAVQGGFVTIAGSFDGTVDFDPSNTGTAILTSAGNYDIFIARYTTNGAFVWAKQLGGSTVDVANAVAVDESGNVYTTGYFRGTGDFDPGPGTATLKSAGSDDVFVSKLNASGEFIYAKAFGGPLSESGSDLAVDGSGNVYTTGGFQGSGDFDPGAGMVTLTSGGTIDVFVSKLNASGDFVYAKALGGPSNDVGYSVAVDSSGNVYTTGFFDGSGDFDPGAGTVMLTSAGLEDVFVSKLNTSGEYVYAKSLGGKFNDTARGVAVDGNGNVYTTGSFDGSGDFDPGPGTVTLTSAGFADVFVSKLNTSGEFVFAKALGGSSSDFGIAVAVDGSGNVYTSGSFAGSADFAPGAGTVTLTSAGSDDVFVSKLNASGDYVYAKAVGGSEGDIVFGVAVDGSGNVYTIGRFKGSGDFDPGAGTVTLTSAGNGDAFVLKLFGDDSISPTAVSFVRQTPSAATTNADTLTFRVTFSEVVTGVGTDDFAPTARQRSSRAWQWSQPANMT